jgi:hypothetical protein
VGLSGDGQCRSLVVGERQCVSLVRGNGSLGDGDNQWVSLARFSAGLCKVVTTVGLTGKGQCRCMQSGDDSGSHWRGTVQVYTEW